MTMLRRLLLAAASVLALAAAAPAANAQIRNEQDRARQDLAAGHVRSLREIEARVLPMMRGAQYLGPEYDPQARAYRLKFIREGRVVFVDVDGRTGQVMGESR
ncbi:MULTISPECIES: hypothetical protein [Novosphingobium]|nr:MULTISPECIES: hypothetical protein [Novosphingobium]KPF55375.1 hypothetical protein IP65_04415 [Novosphingobium sp. AAP1]MBB3358418.1 nucleoside-specific outer membrane channel protein Tsx [Novosphingobium sp. BK256]MBB3379532.1 nucleoside-specific outer membrane channel protein Tsx [Novosphingobium sp. BK258]MBB3501367.1 nucleoside-specific outer membrane channel protein Tsx [Novosphingobium sp. BK336]MBB3556548.1 nucleoside-specific outer membrane channel protein Tsx [Novosphingobium sp. 